MQLTTLTVLSVVVTIAQSAAPVFRADAADKVQAGFKKNTRRGVTKMDMTKIEVKWAPFAMVEDKETVDKNGLKLELKVGDGEWQMVDQSPAKWGGGKYRLVLDDVLPCKQHLLRFHVMSPTGEEAVFDHPTPIEALTSEEIAASGDFSPAVPSNLNVVTKEGQVEITWDPVECASAYEVAYRKITDDAGPFTSKLTETNSILLEEGIDTCSEYELSLSSLAGDAYSDDEATTEFLIPPAYSAAEKLNPTITPGITSVTVSWDAWEKLSCVESYSVKLCKNEEACGEAVTLEMDDSLTTIEFVSEEELEECSPYTFNIQPIFPGQDLQEIAVPFDTRSPTIDGITEKLQPVIASAGEEQMITVTWSPVQCASGYEIFQHVSSKGGDWETIGNSVETELSIKGVPCTEYRYGVKVTIDGQQSEIVEAAEPVMTHLPSHTPYVASNLIITPTTEGAELTWDHAQCISSYRLKVCKDDSEPEDCSEEEIVMGFFQHNISKKIEDLQSCSGYQIQIFATSNDVELDAEPQSFSTPAPPASSPENATVGLNSDTNQIDISFNPVECATSYKVYRKLDDDELEMIQEITEVSTSLPIPDSCAAYSFGVSSVVDGEESEQSPLLGDIVPPVNGEQNQPELVIEDRFNNTAIVLIKLPEANHKCQVETYNVKYQNLGFLEPQELLIEFSEIQDGKIILDDFPGAGDNGMKIEGRIKYLGFDSWSPWISTSDPVPVGPLSGTESNSLLVPIVIGILVAVVVLCVVIFFIVKRKKSQAKYDAEKASENEESKRLNPEV